MATEKAYKRIETEEEGEFTFAVISGKGFKAHKRNDYMSYKVTLEIPESEAKRLIKEIKAFWKENKPKDGGKNPDNLESLVYFNEKTEKWSISPHSRTKFEDKDVKIGIVDCEGEKLDPEVFGKIGAGSTGYVSMNLTTYDEGVSMYLNSVQLMEFVPFAGGSGDGSGNFTKKKGKTLSGEKSFSKKEKNKKKKKKKSED